MVSSLPLARWNFRGVVALARQVFAEHRTQGGSRCLGEGGGGSEDTNFGALVFLDLSLHFFCLNDMSFFFWGSDWIISLVSKRCFPFCLKISELTTLGWC